MQKSDDRVLTNLEFTGHLVAKVCLSISAIALFTIVAINAGNIALRHFVGGSWVWSEEAMLYAMILAVFAGAVAATWHGSHMRFDIFVSKLHPRWRRIVVIFVGLLSVGILAVLGYASYQVVSLLYSFGQTSVSLEFPMWIAQGCVLVGFGLIACMILLRLVVFDAAASHSELQQAEEIQQ